MGGDILSVHVVAQQRLDAQAGDHPCHDGSDKSATCTVTQGSVDDDIPCCATIGTATVTGMAWPH